MAAGKTWRDYIKKEYETSADHTLPASAWNWMSVQTKNQLNHQAQRALDLQLLDFFFDATGTLIDSAKLALIVADQDAVNLVVNHVWVKQTATVEIKKEVTDNYKSQSPVQLHISQPREASSFSSDEEGEFLTPRKTFRPKSPQETFGKIEIDSFKHLIESVTVFERVYDTAILSAWIESIQAVLSHPVSESWFKTDTDKIRWVILKTSPNCQQWMKAMPPPTSVSELLETIRVEHWPVRDMQDARKELQNLRLSSFAGSSGIQGFNHAFQQLLPRCSFTDRYTVVEAYRKGVGSEFWAALSAYEQINSDKDFTLQKYFQFSAFAWANGSRASKQTSKASNAMVSSGGIDELVSRIAQMIQVEKPAGKKRAKISAKVREIVSKEKQPESVPVELFRSLTANEKENIKSRPCYYCGKGGHFSRNCVSKTSLKQISLGEESDSRYCEPSSADLSLVSMGKKEGEEEVVAALNKIYKASIGMLPLLRPGCSDKPLYEPTAVSSIAPPKTQLQDQQKRLKAMDFEIYKDGARPFTHRKQEYLAAIAACQHITPTPYVESGSPVPLISTDKHRCHVQGKVESRPMELILDSGATGMFMGHRIAAELGLVPAPLAQSIAVGYAKESTSEVATMYVNARITIGNYWKDLNFVLADIGESVILGVPWFNTVEFTINLYAGEGSFTDMLTGRFHKFSTAGHAEAPSIPQSRRTENGKRMKRIAHTELRRIWRSATIFEVHLSQTKTTNPPQATTKGEDDAYTADLVKKFSSVFAPMTGLPVERPEDMKIDLVPGSTPPKTRALRNQSREELVILKERIQELLERGFIQPSTSEYGASILFVKKADGTLRLCIDYRGLNSITVKNRAPLPSITEMRNRLIGAQYFTKLDLKDGYHNIRINSADVHKTAFKCRYGHFEYLVVPFGLANAPAVFSNMMNRVFRSVLDICVISYLDDILIYSPTVEQHQKDIEQVLGILSTEKLFLKLSKCEFKRSEVTFCGHYVGRSGIRPTEDKVAAIKSRPRISNVQDIQAYLGSIVWFHDFIPDYAAITEPLTRLLAKDTPWSWTAEQEEAITLLIHLISSAPVLRFFDPTLETFVYSDASEFAIGGWIGQKYADGIHPVLYWSRKMTPTERRYHVYEKELLALISLVEREAHLLRSVSFTCNTDHRSLEHLQS